MLRLLSERGLSGGVDASGIRSIICAGSKLDARTLEAARRRHRTRFATTHDPKILDLPAAAWINQPPDQEEPAA